MTEHQTPTQGPRQRAGALLRDQAGDYLVSTIAGTVVGALLLAALTYAITGIWTSQSQIQLTSDKAADVVSMEAAFRQDVTWSANIPSQTASESGFTAVVPGTGIDGACRVSTWVSTAGEVKNISQTFERARQNPGVYTPGSETGSTGCTGEMVAEDERAWQLPGAALAFSYRDRENAHLVKVSPTKFAREGSTDAVRIGAVQFTHDQGGTALQPAMNLDEHAVSVPAAAAGEAPAGDPGLMVTIWDPSLQQDIYGATHACAPGEFPLVLPLRGEVDVDVDWGDGSDKEWVTAPYPFHCYPNGIKRTVVVSGTFTGWGEMDTPMYGIGPQSGADKPAEINTDRWPRITERTVADLMRQRTTWSSNALLAVDLWEDRTGTTDLSEAFYGAENLTNVAEIPETATDLTGALAFTTKNVAGVSAWKTPNVTSMRGLFHGATGFNQDLAGWDTTRVKDMSSMFAGASAFNRAIPAWNTAQVTDMSQMFSGASVFNSSVAGLNTQNVTDMSQMFRDAVKFNQPVAALRTANVTDMTGMFHGALVFNQPITHANWDTSKVSSMAHLFEHAQKFNSSVAGLETPAVTAMNDMFHFARVFNQPVAHLNTAKATTLSRAFMEARAFSQDISGWNTSAVTDMSGMFSYAKAFNQPIGGWNTANVVTMSGMFHDADAFNQSVNTWDVGKVKDMSGMFSLTDTYARGLMSWKPASLEDASFMFNGAQAFVHSINDWGPYTGNLKYTQWMFANSPSYNQPMDQWNTSKVTTMSNMFMNADSFNQDLNTWNVSNVTDFSAMFANNNAFNGKIGTWNVAKAERADEMLRYATAFTQNLATWKLDGTEGRNAGFAQYSGISELPTRWPCAVRWQVGAATC